MNLFLEPYELIEKINKGHNLKILDATFFLPNSNLNAEDEFNKEHIPNAIFFDINKIADPTDPLPHMIPSKEIFSGMMKDLGLNNEDEIIIYDNSPFLSSARAWFLFRYFGHYNLFILKGGLKRWKEQKGIVTEDKTNITLGNFVAKIEKKELVKKLDDMIKISNDKDTFVLDARSYTRFIGEAKEPRNGLESGHIPNSKSLPSSDFINNDGQLKSINEINLIFNDKNITGSEKIIATCGSGVSACVISLALHYAKELEIPIYDGSWTEWASSGQKIAKGKD
jgi:thiosulfate/3-mercaptopyruvate sulfurtransferase